MAKGLKVWSTGDILQAADVNDYLSEQVVMNYADEAARDAAIAGGTTLVEGMAGNSVAATGQPLYNFSRDKREHLSRCVEGLGKNVSFLSSLSDFATEYHGYDFCGRGAGVPPLKISPDTKRARKRRLKYALFSCRQGYRAGRG